MPQGLPDPSDEFYVESLLDAMWPLVEATGGGAFLLFTSYRALQRAEAVDRSASRRRDACSCKAAARAASC